MYKYSHYKSVEATKDMFLQSLENTGMHYIFVRKSTTPFL